MNEIPWNSLAVSAVQSNVPLCSQSDLTPIFQIESRIVMNLLWHMSASTTTTTTTATAATVAIFPGEPGSAGYIQSGQIWLSTPLKRIIYIFYKFW